MVTRPYISKVAWADDDPKMIEKSTHRLEHAFMEVDNSLPKIQFYQDPYELLDILSEDKEQFDYIFLDIDFGKTDVYGTYFYKKIREINKDIVIAFVSAHLKHNNWEGEINELQSKDKDLFTIAVPFPTIEDEDFDDLVVTPIKQITERFELKHGLKSTDHIPAQILEIEQKHVLVNCLLDPEARQFQIRRFDIEPIEDAVTLKTDQLIIIEIKTYVGKRIFTFKDNKDAKWKPYFERKMYFDGSEDYSEFLNPKATKNESDL